MYPQYSTWVVNICELLHKFLYSIKGEDVRAHKWEQGIQLTDKTNHM